MKNKRRATEFVTLAMCLALSGCSYANDEQSNTNDWNVNAQQKDKFSRISVSTSDTNDEEKPITGSMVVNHEKNDTSSISSSQSSESIGNTSSTTYTQSSDGEIVNPEIKFTVESITGFERYDIDDEHLETISTSDIDKNIFKYYFRYGNKQTTILSAIKDICVLNNIDVRELRLLEDYTVTEDFEFTIYYFDTSKEILKIAFNQAVSDMRFSIGEKEVGERQT